MKPEVNVLVGGPINGVAPCQYKTKILKANLSFKGQVENDPNTKFVIKWDFDLEGKTVTIPENCILQFEGGSLRNGTIIGQNTTIVSDTLCFEDVYLTGSFVGEFRDKWLEYDFETIDINLFFSNIFAAGFSKVLIEKDHSIKQEQMRIYSNTEVVINGTLTAIVPILTDFLQLIYMQDAENIYIHGNGTIIGGRGINVDPISDGQWQHGIAVKHCKNVTIEGLTIKAFNGDGISLMQDAESETADTNHSEFVTLRGLDISDVGRNCISVIQANNYVIENCYLHDCTAIPQYILGYGIDVEPNRGVSADNVVVSNGRITNCTFNNLFGGVCLYGSHAGVRNVEMSNLKFYDMKTFSISVDYSRNTSIKNIYIDDSNDKVSDISIKFSTLTEIDNVEIADESLSDSIFFLQGSYGVKINNVKGRCKSFITGIGTYNTLVSGCKISTTLTTEYSSDNTPVDAHLEDEDSFVNRPYGILQNGRALQAVRDQQGNILYYLVTISSFGGDIIVENSSFENEVTEEQIPFVSLYRISNLTVDNVKFEKYIFGNITDNASDIVIKGCIFGCSNYTSDTKLINTSSRLTGIVMANNTINLPDIESVEGRVQYIVSFGDAKHSSFIDNIITGTYRFIALISSSYTESVYIRLLTRQMGTSEEYPYITSVPGFVYYDTDKNKPLVSNGADFREFDGVSPNIPRTGSFAGRPTGANIYVGFVYFCTNRTMRITTTTVPQGESTVDVVTGISVIQDSANGGMPIYYKGQDTTDPENPVDIWVDALGRVVE